MNKTDVEDSTNCCQNANAIKGHEKMSRCELPSSKLKRGKLSASLRAERQLKLLVELAAAVSDGLKFRGE